MELKQNYWDYNFKEGFLLSENSLYKIKDIIEKRLKEIWNENPLINFIVERKDWLMFTTNDVNQIISEYNWLKDSIMRIMIIYDNDNNKITLDFNPIKDTNLNIEWFSKDFIILLSWDLKDYLSNYVLVFRKFDIKERNKEITIVILALILFYMFYSLYKINSTDLTNILKSEDINEKINFLIQYKKNQDQLIPPLLILSPFIVPIFIFWLTWILEYFYPRNIFYFWQSKINYDKKIERRKFFIGSFIISSIFGWLIVTNFSKILPF